MAELLLLLQARKFIPSFLICKNLGPQCMLEQCRVKIANPQLQQLTLGAAQSRKGKEEVHLGLEGDGFQASAVESHQRAPLLFVPCAPESTTCPQPRSTHASPRLSISSVRTNACQQETCMTG